MKNKKAQMEWGIGLFVILIIGIITIVVIGKSIGFGIFGQSIVSQEVLPMSEWHKSVISCSIPQDCIDELTKENVSVDNINTINFKCEDKLCYFKSK